MAASLKYQETARLDKWLWAARIFKTRTIAADACKNGRVTVDGQVLKPARTVKVGEVVSVKKPPITYSFKILNAIETRVGAKLISEVREITPEMLASAGGGGTALSTGGMATKLTAARICMESGTDMFILNGAKPLLLYEALEGKPVGTKFIGREHTP